MPFDFKKEFKELYAPKTTPALINVPQMHFIAVRGKGNPNTSSEYQTSVELCYTLAYALKMSHKKGYEKDISLTRFHHEIYLNDPRKCEANKLKTILRVPIRKI